MKRLLMISYPFPPLSVAGAIRSERFARYLSKFGWAVEVITIKPRRDLFADKARLERLGKNVNVHFTSTLDPWLVLKEKRSRGFFLRCIRSILMTLFSFPDHALLWLPFAIKAGVDLCRRTNIDAIYSTSPPHSSHLAGLVLSRLLRKPWIVDFRDPWTQNAYREKGALHSFLLKIERVLEKIVLKKSSAILANTKANRTNLLMSFPFLDKEKVIHVPNAWEEFPRSTYCLNRSARFTIVHAGSFYPRFRPYSLLYALAAWKNGKNGSYGPLSVEDIQVIILSHENNETKRIVQDLAIEDIVHIRPWLALDEARKIMCQADVLWASLGTGKESSTYIPSKLFEYIAAKRPIVGFFPEGEAAALIRDTGTGIVFTSDNPLPIIRALNLMRLAYKERSQVIPCYNRREKVIDSYHIRVIVKRLACVLDYLET